MTSLAERLAAQARRFGPLPFSVFMEAALYDEEGGFFASGAGAGRRADFVTSPELGPLFATVMARALDEWWEELGRPDPYIVVEAGAGSGTLAAGVLASRPACAPALRYVLVERAATLREAQPARLAIELPGLVLGPVEAPVSGAMVDDEDPRRVANAGPLVTSLPDLPAISFTGVILANELLDNLPVDLLEWRGGTWHEVRVRAAGDGGTQLQEVLIPAEADVAAEADRFSNAACAAPLVDGARIPRQRAAARWVTEALELVDRGRLVAIDYGDRTPAMARRPFREWLRTYRNHQRGEDALEGPGSQDITCEVAVDQLGRVPPAARFHIQNQAEFLRVHGIDDLAGDAARSWRARAHIGDLEALKARSRVHEADALCDPEGMGGFAVLEWRVGTGG